MKLKSLLVAAIFSSATTMAQDTASQNANVSSTAKNILKVNITSLPLKNYHLQYERILSKKISVAIGGRFMPASSIPFKTLVLNAVGDDQDTKDLINQSEIGNTAISPEVRFYLGKGYGKGFYIAPYYRYANFSTNTITLTYSASNGPKRTVNMSGEMSAHTGGVMLGAQWSLGKHVSLDWWIVGAHYGTGNGSFNGTPDVPLTPSEQENIRQMLEDIDVPLVEKKVTVTANKIAAVVDGPFGGLRSGILLGIRF